MTKDNFIQVVSGVVGGISGSTIGFPLDKIKVLMQSNPQK
jgi:hypothetical protein